MNEQEIELEQFLAAMMLNAAARGRLYGTPKNLMPERRYLEGLHDGIRLWQMMSGDAFMHSHYFRSNLADMVRKYIDFRKREINRYADLDLPPGLSTNEPPTPLA